MAQRETWLRRWNRGHGRSAACSQALQYKAEEAAWRGGTKSPAQMGVASGTKADTPSEPIEPRKFRRLPADGDAACGRLETTDFKDDALGVEKRVAEGTVDRDALMGKGDQVAALSAKNGIVLFGLGLLPAICLGTAATSRRQQFFETEWARNLVG